jgi:polar amino acid transport system substrate-binding protein
MKKRLCALLAVLFAGAAPAGAAETFDAYATDVEPWGFGKTQSGITPEFFSFLAAQTGIALHVDVRPNKRVLDGLRDGDNAMAMVIPGADRDLMGIPICEPALVQTTIAFLKAYAPRAPTLEWLKDKTIGELRDNHTIDRLSDLVTYRNAIIDTQAQGLAMVAAGRIDATVCLHPGCVSAMKQAELDPAIFGEIVFSAGPMAIYVSRASPLAQDFTAVDKLRKACESPAGRTKMTELLRRWD